jgi:NifU-like protein involved in Fe-S cluster formation
VDEVVIKCYRRLLKTGFEHAGSLDNPSIFLDSGVEGIPICGGGEGLPYYLHMFINVANGRIDTIKYLCSCDPASNVAVEILCGLAKGKTLEEVAAIKEDSFFQVIGSRSEEVREKVKGLLELVNRGITKYRTDIARTPIQGEGLLASS